MFLLLYFTGRITSSLGSGRAIPGSAGADGEGEDAHQALRDVLGELLHVAPDLVDRARAADVLRDALPVPLVQLQAFQEPRVLLLRPRLLRGPGAR